MIHPMTVAAIMASRRRSVANITDGLIGWWKLDDAAGSTAVDSSGSNHDGTLVGPPTWVAGKINGALDFDEDEVVVPHHADFNLVHFTISTWARPSVLSSSTGRVLVQKWEGSGASTQCWYFALFSDKIRFVFHDSDGTRHDVDRNITLSTDTYYNVAVTYDGSAIRLYVNATQVGADYPFSGSFYVYTGADVRIAYSAAAIWMFAGILDDLRIYDRALSGAEISTLYNWTP